jgi:hypothetical protein
VQVFERAPKAVELIEEMKDDVHAFIVDPKTCLEVLNESAAMSEKVVSAAIRPGMSHSCSTQKSKVCTWTSRHAIKSCLFMMRYPHVDSTPCRLPSSQRIVRIRGWVVSEGRAST